MIKRLLLELMSEGINISFHAGQLQNVRVHLHKIPYHVQLDIPRKTFEEDESATTIMLNSAKSQLNYLHREQN